VLLKHQRSLSLEAQCLTRIGRDPSESRKTICGRLYHALGVF
jgi:hypothetical protein